MKTSQNASNPSVPEAVPAAPLAKPLTDRPPVDPHSLDAWTQQIMRDMLRMANDEEYRKRIAIQLR